MAPKKKKSASNQSAAAQVPRRLGGRPVAPALPGLELGALEDVVAFMDRHDLESFEFARGDLRVSLRRGNSAARPAAQAMGRTSALANAVAKTAPTESDAPPETAATAPAKSAPQEHIIKSPIVGTFYLTPNPEAPPFVKQGDTVSQGQVICIVEAMKLMNEIESDVAGEVLRIIAENGQPVEYGEPLFAIRPANA